MPLLHFNYRTNVGSNWINSLQTAILSSSDADLRDRNKLWAKSQLGDLGLSISTKMAMMAVAGARIREHLQHLAPNIAGRQSEFQECLQNEIAFDAGDFPFQFMTDLDGFVFESDSLLDVTKKFIMQFYRTIFELKLDKEGVKVLFRDLEKPEPFYWKLNEIRNFLAHVGSYWPALETVPDQPLRFSVVLLKRINPVKQSHQNLLKECDDVLSGLQAFHKTAHSHLVLAIENEALRFRQELGQAFFDSKIVNVAAAIAVAPSTFRKQRKRTQ